MATLNFLGMAAGALSISGGQREKISQRKTVSALNDSVIMARHQASSAARALQHRSRAALRIII